MERGKDVKGELINGRTGKEASGSEGKIDTR